MQFMRKYIHVAKALKPGLTREAAEFIAEEYAKLRSQDNMQNDNIARVILLSLSLPYIPSLYQKKEMVLGHLTMKWENTTVKNYVLDIPNFTLS